VAGGADVRADQAVLVLGNELVHGDVKLAQHVVLRVENIKINGAIESSQATFQLPVCASAGYLNVT
jgi:hypothetical protein